LCSKLENSVWALILEYFGLQEGQIESFFKILPKYLSIALDLTEPINEGIDVEQEQLIWLMLIEEFFFYR